jgi:hypothetical protein
VSGKSFKFQSNRLATSNLKESQKKVLPFQTSNLKKSESEAIAMCVPTVAAEVKKETIFQKLEVFVYLGLWYIISAYYNVYNKKALNSLKLPWFVATVQVFLCQNYMYEYFINY